MDELEAWFDENIPEEVIDDESWSPRLLFTTDGLYDIDFSYDDMMEDFDE